MWDGGRRSYFVCLEKGGAISKGPVSIEMPGGTLTVGFSGSADDTQDLYLEGPAEVIYRGTVEI